MQQRIAYDRQQKEVKRLEEMVSRLQGAARSGQGPEP